MLPLLLLLLLLQMLLLHLLLLADIQDKYRQLHPSIGFTLHQGVLHKAGCAQSCVLNSHAACSSVPAAACPT
jgi:hypothetical protein